MGTDDPLQMFCAIIVSITPAEVPTHIKSLQANSEVTLKHAALCCLIISSQFVNILFTDGAKFTSWIISKLWGII
jgi:hypothetical protein